MGSEARARIALAALLLTTLFSFELVFARGDYAGPAILAALLAGTIAVIGRRLGVATALLIPLSLAGLVVYLALVFQARNTAFGLPTGAALRGLASSLESAMRASTIDFAPVPVRTGYVIGIVVAMWVATTLGELATFRWRNGLIASAGPVGLTGMALVVGTGRGDVAYLILFLIALLVYWALDSEHRLRSWGRWVHAFKTKPREEPRTLTGALARRMGAACLAATLAAPIFLPGLGGGLLDWRGDTGEGPGDGTGSGAIDLLVDITPRLIEQSDELLFTVAADRAAYWRLASLARFDGTTWHPLDENAEETAGSVPAVEDAVPESAPVLPLRQNYDIEELAGENVPAAVLPVQIDGISALAGTETASLRLADGEVNDGTQYGVTSVVPNPTYAELRNATVGSLDPIYLETGPITEPVEELRREWVSGHDTAFLKLVAIQNRLRTFTYSTDISAGNGASVDYLTKFLLDTKTGFCQQFATAFAVLARRSGFPTRVSVGFLPGVVHLSGDGQYYEVKGTDAHAWPEVYFKDYGWIAFDPTPRPGGISSQPAYTIPPLPKEGFRAGETPGRLGPLETRRAGRNPGNPAVDTRLRDTINFSDGGKLPTPPENPLWKATFGRVITVLLLALLAWLILVPWLKLVRGSRSLRRARTPTDRAIAYFVRFENDAAEFGSPRLPAESARRFAARVAEAEIVDPRAAQRIAAIYEGAAYSADGAGNPPAQEAARLARSLRRSLWKRASLLSRARALWGPATLWAASRERKPAVLRLSLRSARG